MEELSPLDIAIRDSIEKVNAGDDDNPAYCGWALCMRTRQDIVFKHVQGLSSFDTIYRRCRISPVNG